jgi:predicted nucleic acid-binding protein
MMIALASVGDATLTRDQMRGLAIATYTAVLNPDGTIERTVLSTAEQAALREQSQALEALAASLESRPPASADDAVADTMAIAREAGLALWCDDMAIRQKARQAGIQAFCFLDLITCLQRQGAALDQSSLLRCLAGHYVMDLPLGADDITAVAAVSNWNRGPAHTALARPGWWHYQGGSWTRTWHDIATQARKNCDDELFLEINRAALLGATTSVSPGTRTKRYQELVVLTLTACHDVGIRPPGNMLAQLAASTQPGLAPRPQYALMALIAELKEQSVEDPVGVAQSTLPGIDLP